MHDPRLSQRELSEEYSSSGGAARRVPEAEQISDEAGMFRIDAPHQLGDGATQERNNSGSDQGARPDLLTEAFRGASPSPEDQVEDRFFAQVDQIRGYLTNKQKELEQREQRLLTQLAQLDQEQRSVRMWIAQSEEELNGRQEEFDRRDRELSQRESRCRQIEAEVEEERIELLQSRAELETRAERVEQSERRLELDLSTIRAQKEEEWEAERLAMVAEIEQHRRLLEDEHQDYQAAQARLEAEMHQERQLLENRVRFQLDHLDKMRHEMEEHQREFLITQQGLLNRNQRERGQLDLQKHQMLKFRDLLEERERSLERSWDSLHKTRKAFLDNCQEVQGRIDLDQRGLAREHELRQAELGRQHQMLTAHAENLEARHQRLEELRVELEGTHRQLLEMRVAIEESTAQLAQALGEAGARERIDQSRRGISEFYQKSQESLLLQRREIEQLRAGLQQQREEFLKEREMMTDWVKERDDLLKLRETTLRKGEEDLSAREVTWQKLREFWQMEKLQAERVIRDLLRQLEEKYLGPDLNVSRRRLAEADFPGEEEESSQKG